jgi:hypothetical protein
VRLVDQLLGLDDRIRHVQVRIDGEIESAERPGSPAPVAVDADARDEALAGPGTIALSRSATQVRANTRPVSIHRGSVLRIAMACRGGEVSVEVDPGVDPIDVAAGLADVLVRAGR